MNNLRKKRLVKIVAGILLLFVSGFFTVSIRDALAMQNPENSLPELYVYYTTKGEQQRMPTYYVRRDSYEWGFLFGVKEWVNPDMEAWREIQPGQVEPGNAMGLEFSFDPDSYKIYMKAGESPFYEYEGDLTAPTVPGEYTYRVEGSWGEQQKVIFYFRIKIGS